MGARQYTQREWRLLSWWLATFHPTAEIHMNIRLGPVLLPSGFAPSLPQWYQAQKVVGRWADALYIESGAPTIVEAKLAPDPGIYSQLIHYARRFRMDPAWSAYADTPLNLVALVARDDPVVAAEAPAYGVQWVVWSAAPADFAQVPPQFANLHVALPHAQLPSNWPARLRSWGINALSTPP